MTSVAAVHLDRSDETQVETTDISRQFALLMLLAATIVGGLLRFWNLDVDSIWFDEAASWYQSRGTFAELLERTAADNYPPLHNIFLYFIIHNFGDSEWWVRFPSAVFGTLTIPLVYWVAATLHSRRSGVLAAVMIALSIFLIDYSQEARMYSLLALAATAYFGTMIAFLRKPSIIWGAAAAVSGAALTYTHPYGGLTWAVMSAVFAAYAMASASRSRGRVVGFLLIQIAVVAIFLPWALILIERANHIVSSGFWIPYPTLSLILQQFQTIMGGQFAMLVVGCGLGIATLWIVRQPVRGVAPEPIEPRWALAMLLTWALGPWIVAEIASLLLRPIVHERYLTAIAPAFCILAAIGFGAAVRSAAGVLVAVLALVIGMGSALIQWDGWHHDDWRSVAKLVAEGLGPGDCVGIAPGWVDKPFEYYFRDESACVVELYSADDATKPPADIKRLFVVFQYADSFRDDLTARLSQTWPVRSEKSFPGIDVEIFEK
jgi:mannosyltransferase